MVMAPGPPRLMDERRATLRPFHERRQRDLPVANLDDEDARLTLAAFLARGPVLLELDGAVHAHRVHLPERLAHRLRIRLARDPDALGRRQHAVVAAEALG